MKEGYQDQITHMALVPAVHVKTIFRLLPVLNYTHQRQNKECEIQTWIGKLSSTACLKKKKRKKGDFSYAYV